MQILRDYMVSPVISVGPDATLYEAAQLMSDNKIGCLLVKEGDNHTGMLTKSDIIWRALGKKKDPGTTKVDELCTRPLLTMDYLLTVEETREKLLRKNI